MTMFPGQTRETVVHALATAHNDLNRAVEIMLSSPWTTPLFPIQPHVTLPQTVFYSRPDLSNIT